MKPKAVLDVYRTKSLRRSQRWAWRIVAENGRTVATLPRLGKQSTVQGSPRQPKPVSAQDIALLCEEAQLAIAPGMALLEAALAAIGRVARDEEDELV